MKYFILTAFCASTLALSGCFGGGTDVETYATNATMGQELIDLKASFDAGIINEDEYEDAKEDIMERYDN